MTKKQKVHGGKMTKKQKVHGGKMTKKQKVHGGKMTKKQKVHGGKMTKKQKVHVLALGTGYIETASWSQMVCFHKKGFDTIKDALASIYDAVLEADLYEYERDPLETHTRPLIHSSKHDGFVTDALHTIIHGNLQDYGDFWESMSARGWVVGAYWITRTRSKHPIVVVDNSPEIVVIAKTGNISDSKHRIIYPKGLKLQ